jgi:hypothetical protein
MYFWLLPTFASFRSWPFRWGTKQTYRLIQYRVPSLFDSVVVIENNFFVRWSICTLLSSMGRSDYRLSRYLKLCFRLIWLPVLWETHWISRLALCLSLILVTVKANQMFLGVRKVNFVILVDKFRKAPIFWVFLNYFLELCFFVQNLDKVRVLLKLNFDPVWNLGVQSYIAWNRAATTYNFTYLLLILVVIWTETDHKSCAIPSHV